MFRNLRLVLPVLPVLSLGLLAASAPAAWADTTAAIQTAAVTSPKATIESLDQTLLATMKAGKAAGYPGRYKIIAPVIDKTFYFQRIAEISLGSEWGKLNAAQQQQFVKVLGEYTTATYAGRFDDYNSEQFAVTGVQQLRPGTMGVFTTFTMKNGRVHRFDYLLEQADGKDWKIINVVADGVSDLSLKRSEYTETIKSKGFPALIAHLQHEIQGYASGGKS
ncbi:ABC transporter substrate-binding protein [Acidithiobacillus sp. IBUN Pt1247-S3]|uniref:ABC transporter substrate-binding protein n=1 Tax=Acidithiobacillus sp. IBUN Pt1247-S3 TaxID=3166642 RepID=UPI0034E4BFBE